MTLSLNPPSDPISASLDLAQRALSDGLSRVIHDYRPFTKHGAVIDTPPQDAIMHFRDPKVWKEDDGWYLIAGARLGAVPMLPLYRSADLHNWELLAYVSSGNEGDGYMWECPMPSTVHHWCGILR